MVYVNDVSRGLPVVALVVTVRVICKWGDRRRFQIERGEGCHGHGTRRGRKCRILIPPSSLLLFLQYGTTSGQPDRCIRQRILGNTGF